MIYKCHNSAQIWKRVENLISYVEQNRLTISSQHALTGFWREEARDELLLKNVVISITRYHLWKIRNSIKYDAKLIDFVGSSRILKLSLMSHCGVLLSMYSNNNALKQYLDRLIHAMEEGYL